VSFRERFLKQEGAKAFGIFYNWTGSGWEQFPFGRNLASGRSRGIRKKLIFSTGGGEDAKDVAKRKKSSGVAAGAGAKKKRK